MVWALSKGNHELSCSRWVRWWLRAGLGPRFIVTVMLAAIAGGGVMLLIGATTPTSFSLGSRGNSPLMPLTWLPAAIILLFVLDALWDNLDTNGELSSLKARRDVVLATRGEYVGGHPKLPRGRFLYLLLEGSLENPKLTLLLPPATKPVLFPMPVLDLEKTKSQLAKIVSQTAILGRKLTLTIEYTGEAGRKHEVELSHFFHGASEVQGWRNYIVCIQAEAETGQPPYGRWKSLPKSTVDAAAALTSPRLV